MQASTSATEVKYSIICKIPLLFRGLSCWHMKGSKTQRPPNTFLLLRQVLVQEEWHQSLLSWQHPETAYDAAVVALLNSEKAGEIMQHRRLHWQAAFHSLYYALRTEKCRAFYLISPKVQTSVYFPQRSCK